MGIYLLIYPQSEYAVSDNAVNVIFLEVQINAHLFFFMIHLDSSFSDGINKSAISIPVSPAVARNIECRNWKYLDRLVFLKTFIWFNHISCIYIPCITEIKYFAFVTGVSKIFRVSMPLKWSQAFYFCWGIKYMLKNKSVGI